MSKEEIPVATTKKDVSLRKKIWQFFWRSWAIQDSWNYERQMNMGFLYGLVPTLDRCYPDESDPKQLERKKEAYRRHMAFYNCTPQTSAFVLGLSASMEENYAEDPTSMDPDSINAVKTSLMGPLSGVGDSFFQGTIRVIAFGLGVQLAQQGSVLGPVLAMVISIIPSVLITWFAAKLGYQGGHQYLQKLQSGNMMDKVMYVCGIVGLMAVGGMIATLIGATTPATFSDGTLVIQDILDSIMPQMIPLALTGIMYWLIKRGVKTGWLLVIAIVGGVILSALGILA
ncbi:PTS system mannose/fructose/sorbose family transporter subunit IID [Collinsella tanakaei]|nr:PTS system mannose/fructose/sorbose family transporter subunit IID [Collinsella tanakaei]MBM6868265.1 PTS system mannose/fructose/sorbose family transporter subunit IID [Collinsella tanakaei]